MSLKSKVVAFALIGAFSLASTQLLAEGKSKTPKLSKNEKKAKAILKEMEKVSYSYKYVINYKNRKMIFYVKRYKDGIVKQRIETIRTNPRTGFISKHCFIDDCVNNWDVYSNIAIKNNTLKKVQERVAKNSTKNNKQTSIRYHVENTLYKGIPCYKVTCKFKHKVMETKKWYPGLNILWIGKKNFYTYCSEMYDANGKLILRSDNSNVEFLDDLSDDLFKIPDDCRIYIAETSACWRKLTAIAINAQMCEDTKNAKQAQKDFKSLYGTNDVASALKAACDKYNSQKEEDEK